MIPLEESRWSLKHSELQQTDPCRRPITGQQIFPIKKIKSDPDYQKRKENILNLTNVLEDKDAWNRWLEFQK